MGFKQNKKTIKIKLKQNGLPGVELPRRGCLMSVAVIWGKYWFVRLCEKGGPLFYGHSEAGGGRVTRSGQVLS